MRLSVALLFLFTIVRAANSAGAQSLPTAAELEAKHVASVGIDYTNARMYFTLNDAGSDAARYFEPRNER
jgi:hypothetical protein